MKHMSSPEFSKFIQTVGEMPLLTATEEKALARRIQAGDHHAKQILVERNVKLAIHNAKRFARMGFDLEDLVQAGTIGLLRAAAKFDPDHGGKFSTYATHRIRKEIQEYINGGGNMNIMKIPHDVPQMQRKVAEAMEAGADLETGINIAAKAHNKTPEQVRSILHVRRDMSSLDSASYDEDGETRYQKIKDEHAPDPANVLEDTPELTKAMALLSKRQRRIIELRFGFYGREVHSRNGIADEMGIKPAVVKREQARAIAILRRTMVADRLGVAEDDDEERLRIAFEQLEAGMLQPAGEEICKQDPT